MPDMSLFLGILVKYKGHLYYNNAGTQNTHKNALFHADMCDIQKYHIKTVATILISKRGQGLIGI